jgi:hypothetical protein
VRIQHTELANPRGAVIMAILIVLIDAAGQSSVNSGVGSWMLHAVCGVILLWFVRAYFRLRRKVRSTWVEVTPTGLTWSTLAETVERGLSPSGSLGIDQVAALTVAEGQVRLKLAIRTKNVRVHWLQVTATDGTTCVMPITSSWRRVSPALQRLLGAIKATPGYPVIDESVLPSVYAPLK